MDEFRVVIELLRALGLVPWLGGITVAYLVFRIIKYIAYVSALGGQIHEMYGFSGEIWQRHRNAIIERVLADIKRNGKLGGTV